MARSIPPQLISYTETAWNTSGASKNVSISYKAGDVIVIAVGDEGNGALTFPGQTLSFTTRQQNNSGTQCASLLATAQPTADGTSVTVTVNNSIGTHFWGFGVWVYRGSGGVGASGEQHTTTHTVSIVPVDTHSSWVVACFDFSAAVVTGNSITPTVTNDREKTQTTQYSIYAGDIVDQASGASTPYGLTAGGTTGAISIIAVEVLGLVPAPSNLPYRGKSGTFMAADWWAGNAAAVTPKCTLTNLAASKTLVAVRSCLVDVDAFVTALTTPVDIGLWQQAAVATVGAATLTKVSAGTGADAAQTSDANVELRSRHSADNSAATAITLTVGTRIAWLPQNRPHTLVEQMYSVYIEKPLDETGFQLLPDTPLILRPGESLAVQTVGATANVITIQVNWLWDEYVIHPPWSARTAAAPARSDWARYGR